MDTQVAVTTTAETQPPREHHYDSSLGIALQGLAPFLFVMLLLTHFRRLKKHADERKVLELLKNGTES